MTIQIVDERALSVSLYRASAEDIDVARAAWVSLAGESAKEKDSDHIDGLLNFLYRNGHMSPFEHGQFTFMINCPIFVARQIQRHRTTSFNEVSGRYSKLEPKFYVPNRKRNTIQSGKVGNYTFLRGNLDQFHLMDNEMVRTCKQAWDSYEKMLEAGIANEVARMILPLNTFTSYFLTLNPRNLMHMLGLRTESQAQYEVQVIAQGMEVHFAKAMPLTYALWKANIDT